MAEDVKAELEGSPAPQALTETDGQAEPLVADVGFIAGRLMRDSVRASFKPFARKTCEHCRSKIHPEASVCRFCGLPTS